MRLLHRRNSLILIVLAIVACGSDAIVEVDDPVPTTILLSASSIELEQDETAQLSATVLDQNGQAIGGAPVSWTSDNQGVATVSGSGLVSGVGAGTTDVRARSGTLEATAVVVVTAPPPPTLSRVIISPGSATLVNGATQQFSAAGELSDGSPATIEVVFTATGGTITTNGLYTAGGAAGDYEVVATEPNSALADTANATITSAPPGGFTTLYTLDSFAGQNLSQIFVDRSGGDGTQTVVGDWFRQTIPPGASGGWADIFLEATTAARAR